jgi:hypothetical protein
MDKSTDCDVIRSCSHRSTELAMNQTTSQLLFSHQTGEAWFCALDIGIVCAFKTRQV